MTPESLGNKFSVERLSECNLPLRIRRIVLVGQDQLSPELLEKNSDVLAKNAKTYLTFEHESTFQMIVYRDLNNGKEHLAVIKGLKDGKDIPIRIHSACLTAETFHTPICDCEEQMRASLAIVDAADAGGVIWMNQEGMDNGLAAKIAQINSEFKTGSYDPITYHGELFVDRRDYHAAADILRDLGIKSVYLITNNPSKVEGIQQAGIIVTGRIPCIIDDLSSDASSYLDTRRTQGYLG